MHTYMTEVAHRPGAGRLERTIIRVSPAFDEVLRRAEMVASSDTTVLLTGETGTGKELMAQLLHDRSRRASRPFVPINCAALPDALVESELFGHERGAFTGALSQKRGKFEVADGGTLFLDEVADLPPQAQAKLLRVLEDFEIQRIGSTRSISVDVRVIAATNQDLTHAVETGRFRRDLFFRLSVFPIQLPPLRDRLEDVPALARHFVALTAHKLRKAVQGISAEAIHHLANQTWPGNVRELRNVIERGVIMMSGPMLQLADVIGEPRPQGVRPSCIAGGTAQTGAAEHGFEVLPFAEAERRAILRALAATRWRISGGRGAAQLLGLKPTTLHAKMRKLGIQRPRETQDVLYAGSLAHESTSAEGSGAFKAPGGLKRRVLAGTSYA